MIPHNLETCKNISRFEAGEGITSFGLLQTHFPSISKLLENTVQNLIANNHFDFKLSHSTNHQITRITTDITRQYNNNKTTAILLIDFQKAFDKVWKGGLLFKLIKLQMPMYIIILITIDKPGKPSNNSSSYRSVSFYNTILAEKIICVILSELIFSKKIISEIKFDLNEVIVPASS